MFKIIKNNIFSIQFFFELKNNISVKTFRPISRYKCMGRERGISYLYVYLYINMVYISLFLYI